jgi:hypothetical protein
MSIEPAMTDAAARRQVAAGDTGNVAIPAALSTGQMAQHRMSDWLELHNVSAMACQRLIADIPMPQPSRIVTLTTWTAPCLAAAWEMTQRAMQGLFPAQADIVTATFDHTEKTRIERSATRPRAVTLDNGAGAFPTIVYSYEGDPGDLLMLAHEFGHALQLRMSERRFVPPVIRETCAFLAERALLAATRIGDPLCYRYLREAAWADDARYFGRNRDLLEHALARPDTAYRYAWNYPIARYMAICIDRYGSPDQSLALFRGRLTVSDLLDWAPRVACA